MKIARNHTPSWLVINFLIDSFTFHLFFTRINCNSKHLTRTKLYSNHSNCFTELFTFAKFNWNFSPLMKVQGNVCFSKIFKQARLNPDFFSILCKVAVEKLIFQSHLVTQKILIKVARLRANKKRFACKFFPRKVVNIN